MQRATGGFAVEIVGRTVLKLGCPLEAGAKVGISPVIWPDSLASCVIVALPPQDRKASTGWSEKQACLTPEAESASRDSYLGHCRILLGRNPSVTELDRYLRADKPERLCYRKGLDVPEYSVP